MNDWSIKSVHRKICLPLISFLLFLAEVWSWWNKEIGRERKTVLQESGKITDHFYIIIIIRLVFVKQTEQMLILSFICSMEYYVESLFYLWRKNDIMHF